MNYPPKHYNENSEAMSLKVMRLFPLATVITSNDTVPDVTMMPLLASETKNGLVLHGHIDRNNPQLAELSGGKVKVLFKGPDVYISPMDYISKDQLPTWNYAYVEVIGKSEFISEAECRKLLVRMADELDTKGWKLDHEDPRIEKLLPYIQGFQINIDSMTNRFKLSQDKTLDDQIAVNKVMRQDTRNSKFVSELQKII